MTMIAARRKKNQRDEEASALWPVKKKNLLQRIPIDVYFGVVLFGGLLTAGIFTVVDWGERVKKAQAKAEAFRQEVAEATGGQVEIRYGEAVTPSSTSEIVTSPEAIASPAGFDFTILFSIAGALAVLGVASYIFVPRIKSALQQRRERKALKTSNTAAWTKLIERRESLMLAWSKYETDVSLMIDYPIMTDYTDPVVHKVITAMQKVRKASMMMVDTSSPALESPLHDAVDEFEAAFNTAEKYARRYGQTKLDPKDQRKLATARTALNIILDGEAPAYEVQAAYKSLRSSLKGIIDVPEKAMLEVEAMVRREIAGNSSMGTRLMVTVV